MVELSPRERAILTFEREWWKHAEAKDTAARSRLGLSPEDYSRALGAIIDHPRARGRDPPPPRPPAPRPAARPPAAPSAGGPPAAAPGGAAGSSERPRRRLTPGPCRLEPASCLGGTSTELR